LNTRALAADALCRVTGDGQSLTAALEAVLPRIPPGKDRAFVQALCYGVARWYYRLNFILDQIASKPIRDEQIYLLALLGLYQLEYTRVKPHAAVAETVAAAGRKAWAKPLLNAVLRRFQREREALIALADSEISSATAHPVWLVEAIQVGWPTHYRDVLHNANQAPPLTLRVNRRQGGRDAYLEQLRSAGIAAHACAYASAGITLETPQDVETLPGFLSGAVSVQDEAAQLAAALLDLRPGQRVLDLCAAPGGKTLHILESEPGLAEVVALDIAPERLTRIRENLNRAGLQATLLCGDASQPADWWDGKPFDRMLLDAPCSATGVIRRHPDIKLLRRPDDIAKLGALQRNILRHAWPLLAEGGLLVYATCSIMPAENALQVADFLQTQPQARELPIAADWGQPCAVGRQILSGEGNMDGFYYARLAK
jgi:16S rRNA (cytosine967-C5)-methyltransferase